MPSEDTKILEYNQYQKSEKTLFVINADLESLIKSIDRCKNIIEKSSTTKVNGTFDMGIQRLRYRYLMIPK